MSLVLKVVAELVAYLGQMSSSAKATERPNSSDNFWEMRLLQPMRHSNRQLRDFREQRRNHEREQKRNRSTPIQ